MSGTLLTLLLIGVGALYGWPSWIAYVRHHPNRLAIYALNLLLGWCLVGWVVALVWSLTAVRQSG